MTIEITQPTVTTPGKIVVSNAEGTLFAQAIAAALASGKLVTAAFDGDTLKADPAH